MMANTTRCKSKGTGRQGKSLCEISTGIRFPPLWHAARLAAKPASVWARNRGFQERTHRCRRPRRHHHGLVPKMTAKTMLTTDEPPITAVDLRIAWMGTTGRCRALGGAGRNCCVSHRLSRKRITDLQRRFAGRTGNTRLRPRDHGTFDVLAVTTSWLDDGGLRRRNRFRHSSFHAQDREGNYRNPSDVWRCYRTSRPTPIFHLEEVEAASVLRFEL